VSNELRWLAMECPLEAGTAAFFRSLLGPVTRIAESVRGDLHVLPRTLDALSYAMIAHESNDNNCADSAV
jgi:hypothetical protein